MIVAVGWLGPAAPGEEISPIWIRLAAVYGMVVLGMGAAREIKRRIAQQLSFDELLASLRGPEPSGP